MKKVSVRITVYAFAWNSSGTEVTPSPNEPFHKIILYFKIVRDNEAYEM